MITRHIVFAAATLCCMASTGLRAQAPSSSSIDDEVLAQIRSWLLVPVVYLTLDAQNERYAAIGSADISRLDAQWQSEREADVQPLIASTLNNPLSTYLTQVQAGSAGLFTEIFVIDAKGLNAGQSSITSDFWQGDEAKFQKTYDVGGGAVFVDEPEFHDATSTWRAQANLTIQNAAGTPIGAATVEVNLTELARRKQAQKGGN